jgi:hypothetical protein
MAGSRRPGPQCAYGDPVNIEDGTMCRALSSAPGPVGGLPLVLVSDQRTKPVSSMTHQERMEEAIRRAHEKGQISEEILRQLPSITDLAIGIVVVGGVLVGLGVAAAAVASTGVGAIIEAIAAAIVLALAAVGIIASLGQIIEGIKTLVTFYEATRTAMTYDDLDRAGKDFATGLAEVGVGTLMMILSVVGARQGLKMAKGAAARAGSGPKESTPGKPAREPEPKPKPAKRNYRDDPRFEELRKDPQTGKPSPKSDKEAEAILQAEEQYPDITNPRRPNLQRGEPNLDFKTDKGWVDVKTPEPGPFRDLNLQARDIADKSRLYDPDVKVLVDLNNIPPADRGAFVEALRTSGGDMSKIFFVPR